MSAEEKDLETHVALCELRYRALETRLDGLENRLVKLETDVAALRHRCNRGSMILSYYLSNGTLKNKLKSSPPPPP